MEVQELMRKRVIVENLWPGCGFEVGAILYFTDDKIGGPMYVDDLDSGYPSFLTVAEVEPFPYLMRPLKWYEEREESDMPEYVRIIEEPYKGEVLHLPDYEKGSTKDEFEFNRPKLFMMHMAFTEPATEQEYLDYLKEWDSKN